MDVSCPRCKTDYEFDDARVPDAGVTVKCTQCSHVFRVRKKSMPSSSAQHQKPDDETLPGLPKHASPTREWKVRQPTGNVFSFKELTTLQKWIVERKVSRDDEISLTGEAWKRLGNIAELASFFQVVDDARQVQELEALQQMKEKLSTSPSSPPALPPSAHDEPSGVKAASQSGSVPAPGERAGLQAIPPEALAFAVRNRGEAPTLPPEELSTKRKLTETMREPQFISPPPRAKLEVPPPFRPPPPPISELLEIESREDLRQMKRSGGSGVGTWVALFLVLAGLGGAAGWYFVVFQPEQQRQKDVLEIQARATADAEAKVKDEEARRALEKADADRKAQEEEDRKKATALALVDAGPAFVDAGALAVVAPTGEPADPRDTTAKDPASKDGKKAGCKNADCFIAQGDRLRDRDRPEAALDAYGKALDLKPENVEALTGKGLCFLDMAKPLQAEPVLEQALKANSRYAPAIMGLAESYRFQGKKELAIGMYQKYLDNFPNAPEAGVAKSNIDRLR